MYMYTLFLINVQKNLKVLIPQKLILALLVKGVGAVDKLVLFNLLLNSVGRLASTRTARAIYHVI